MGGSKRRKLGGGMSRRSDLEAKEIDELNEAIEGLVSGEGASCSGEITRFSELPLSRYTKEALEKSGYRTLTAIQRAALPQALAGRDVLGAAKTGSGKTLAFLIPVLERLYRLKWGQYDGLGALIVSPTRELAQQIFQELRKVGARHDFSAGLLIGGKSVKEEQEHVNGMNILVCTPGRLLQHMDETPGFEAGNMHLLVLDEADRILDMGFSATVNAVIENLPAHRQTLLFSATQTRSVRDLARLSLSDPEYVAVHEEAAAPTPLKLQQAYVVCELGEKLDVIWAFIRSHLKCKVLVFLSTCKQVKFIYEVFRRLRPGSPLRCLHGKMSQAKRGLVFDAFCQAKGGEVLLATDLAARGLDFPSVDWVLQADCPEDVPAYIHRAGRTARYVSGGRSLLVLMPSEKEGMLAALQAAKIPLKGTRLNPHQRQSVRPALQALLSKNTELKELAQRALSAYLRSVFLQPNKAIFDVTSLPVADFALSLGLPTAPELKLLKRAEKLAAKKGSRKEAVGQLPGGPEAGTEAGESSSGEEEREDSAEGRKDGGEEGEERAEEGPGRGKGKKHAQDKEASREERGEEQGPSRKRAREGEAEKGERPSRGGEEQEAGEEEDDFLTVKKRDVLDVGGGSTAGAAAKEAAPTSASAGKVPKKKKLRIKAEKLATGRVTFDEEDEAVQQPFAGLAGRASREVPGEGGFASAAERFAAARREMAAQDRLDAAHDRARRRETALERKAKARARKQEEAAAGAVAVLGPSFGAGEGESEEEEAERDGSGRGSESEEEPERKHHGRKDSPPSLLLPEAAHLGMAPAKPSASNPKHKEREGLPPSARPNLAGLTLADKEALALQLLRRS